MPTPHNPESIAQPVAKNPENIVEPIENDSDEITATALSQLSIDEYLPSNIPPDIPPEHQQLCVTCKKNAYLDGKYFIVDYAVSEPNNVIAVCKTCRPSHKISGRVDVSSNFTTHLKVNVE